MTTEERPSARADDRRGAALQVALRTGLLKRCPVHDEVYDPGQHDYQGACMVASFLVNRSDPLVAAFGDDRAALTGQLRAICGLHPVGCPGCADATAAPPAPAGRSG